MSEERLADQIGKQARLAESEMHTTTAGQYADVQETILSRLQKKRNQLNARLQIVNQAINLIIENPTLVAMEQFQDLYNTLQRMEGQESEMIRYEQRNRLR